jgi:phosphoribosyl 1,2-cyclic phosphodiesterase
VKLVLLGVRGSTPAVGPDFTRWGGHTSCVAVLTGTAEVPSLVLDAGTGLRDLPALVDGRPYRGAIVLSHLHWDHLQGLPFCPVIDHPESEVDLYLPGAGDPYALLARAMSPPHFPIEPGGLLGRWRFEPAAAAPVRTAEIAHKGGTTVGIRVEADGRSVAYLPDHVVGDAAAEELIAGVDVLLHDGQFLDREAERAHAYGHSTLGEALRLADRCEVGRLVLTHHAPARTDAEIDALAAAFRCTPGGRPVAFARQGATIEV